MISQEPVIHPWKHGAGFFIIVKWSRPFYDRCIFGSMHVGARASAKVAKAAKMAAKPRPIASAE
jgi:hypothetical protein